jgi:hypothetical protein
VVEAWDTAGGDGRKGVERARKGRIWSIWQSAFLLQQRPSRAIDIPSQLPAKARATNSAYCRRCRASRRVIPPSLSSSRCTRCRRYSLLWRGSLWERNLGVAECMTHGKQESAPSKGWGAAVVTARPTNLPKQHIDTTSRHLRLRPLLEPGGGFLGLLLHPLNGSFRHSRLLKHLHLLPSRQKAGKKAWRCAQGRW